MRHLLAAAGVALLALTPSTPAWRRPIIPERLPLLAGIEAVRSDLKLNSLQRAVLDSLRDEYKTASRKIFTPRPETPEAQAEALKKLKVLNAQYNARVLSTLNPAQQKRLVQVEQQVIGADRPRLAHAPGKARPQRQAEAARSSPCAAKASPTSAR